MTEPSEIRRFTIELPAEMGARLDASTDYGMKKILYTKLTQMLLEVIDKHGAPGLHLILAGAMEFRLKPQGTKEEAKDESA